MMNHNHNYHSKNNKNNVNNNLNNSNNNKIDLLIIIITRDTKYYSIMREINPIISSFGSLRK